MNFIVRVAQLRKKYFGDEPASPGKLDGRVKAGVAALLFLIPAAALWSKHFDNVHDADSLLASMISLQKVTLFYWGANRFGNLLPFLTGWIHDIDLNFQAQVYLRALGAATIPLFIFSFIGLRKNFLAAYAIALALSLLPFSDEGNAVWVWITPYGHSVPPLWAALLLHRRNNYRLNIPDLLRSLAILLMVCVAFYVNAGLIIFALPLFFGYAVLFPRARNWWFVAILITGYTIYSLLASHYGREYHDAYDYSRMTFSLANMLQFWRTLTPEVSIPVYCAMLAVIAAGLIAMQFAFARQRGPDDTLMEPLVLRSLLIVPPAAIYIILFASMDWVVERNHSAFRYFWFALVLSAPLCSVALTQGLPAAVGLLRKPKEEARDGLINPDSAIALVAIVLLTAAAFHNLAPFGIPSSFVRQPQRADMLALAGAARKYGATYVAGDYYVVWPAVFESIRAAQATGDPAAMKIRGLGLRGEHLRDEIASDLRSSDRVVILGANMSPADCYGHALYNNAVDWPPHGSLLATGPLPSGGTYCVLAFDRNPPGPAKAVPLPRMSAVLMVMLSLDPQIARRDHGRIVVAATGRTQKVWGGPFVNLPSGKYTIAFQIQAAADGSDPLFELSVTDGFGSREYTTKTFCMDDLETVNGSTWASVDFTVPESSPTRVMEFVMTTSGKTPFGVSAMELHRVP